MLDFIFPKPEPLHLPAVGTMACVVHTGPLATIGGAYDALAKWIGQNRYQIVGPGGKSIFGFLRHLATRMIRTR